ncbi:alpha/beta fold hydrolase [Glycomyces sp. TRM65418]|uniref:alpha/beta hydrolase family protein n=1 Tax=Glycomyces sp. TRM65418 TaxID=2867006 RepID=UPI001CE6A4B8|nr:alpha/beta fold hydrolase [Glycomyces sp. TRM65418]MCC3765169.1 alpha/beta fold hydrolase [Glycomyces sp. TRM65418]QZD54794.1 alpha/beta fold hydrolase [Glycomyces sp. TRM65418]
MTTTVETEAPARKRRRWLRPLIIALSVLLVLALAGLGGAGWYFSGEVLKVEHGEDAYSLTVEAVDETTVTLPLGSATERPGTWGLQWEDGQAVVGEIITADDDTVTRALEAVLYGDLTAGTAARIEKWTFRDDPKTGLGLDYSTVDIPTDLGDMPAWLVPAEGSTWVVTVHGRNASPAETLRAVGTYHDLGHPVLAVTYRNDEGAPDAPNGLHSLGEHESDDVVDAVDYALANGAEDVILHGWSMGGATVAVAARKLADTDAVRGMVLDSPVMDWNSTLDMQAADRDVIAPITWAAKRIVEYRADIDLDDLDQRNFADEFDMPMLLFVDTADETVDHRATLEFAELLPPDRTTVMETASGHTASWNEDPAAYEQTLTTYLSTL